MTGQQPVGLVIAGRRMTERVTHIQKAQADWLRDRPDLLARLPSTNQDVEGDRLDALNALHQAWLTEGLIGPKTASPKDERYHHGRWRIRLLVSRLRGERLP